MSSAKSMKIVGFAGSLRKDSFNKALINTAKELAPENVEFEVLDLSGIPLYNQDEEKEMPMSVKEFKRKIKGADAILISTPEYNRSVPGVLKNAIDWASRPHGDNSFDDKPAGLIGATDGRVVGTIVAQSHMRSILSFLNVHLLGKPQLFVTEAQSKIKDGIFVDEHTRESLKLFLEKLVEWTERINRN